MTIRLFEFPGFAPLKTSFTDRHDVVEGSIKCGGVTVRVEMLGDNQLDHLPFLIGSVKTADGTKILWSFADEKKMGFTGLCLLAQTEKDSIAPAVTFIGRGRDGKVERVIALADIAREVRSHDVLANLEMKKNAAAYFGRDVEFTATETRVIQVMTDRKRQQQEAEDAAERKLREEQRKARIDAIMARSEVFGYTDRGVRRVGKPVVGDEWMSLPNGTLVVLVSTYNVETGAVGSLNEAFKVVKEGGRNPKRGFSATITAQMPKAVDSAPKLPQKQAKVVVAKGVQFLDVDVYRNRAEIEELKAAGLNSGTLAGFFAGTPGNVKVEVFRLTKEKMESLGTCEVI